MNSVAIEQNTDDWSSLFASHLDAVTKRAAAALAATGFDSLLVHSGTPPLLFLDDHHLPYRAQAPFKVWAPLADAPVNVSTVRVADSLRSSPKSRSAETAALMSRTRSSLSP